MARKKLGLNKYQKRAYRHGEDRVSGETIEELVDLSKARIRETVLSRPNSSSLAATCAGE